MEIYEVDFTKRKNLGNYEHEEVTMKARISEGEDAMDITARLKFACSQALDMVVKAAPVATEETPAKKKVTKKVTKKAPAKKKTPEKEAVEKETVVQDGPITNAPEKLKAVQDSLRAVIKAKGKEVALEILAEFNVTKSAQLTLVQADGVIALAEKAVK